MNKENILAVPSKDRMRDESLKLLSDAGIQFEFTGRQLTAEATLPEFGNFTLALLRPKDIINMVGSNRSNRIPLGIVGLDILEESKLSAPTYLPSSGIERVQPILDLDIGRCRLVVAAPNESRIRMIDDLEEVENWKGNLFIATSYPGLTERFLSYFSDQLPLPTGKTKRRAIRDPWIWEMGGSIEATPALGLADVITDLVETGSTLKDNGLRELGTIFESQAVLITGSETTQFVKTVKERLSETLSQRVK